MPSGRKKNDPPTLQQQHRSEYGAWKNAYHRCHNPDHEAYRNYGARGIRMCDAWQKSFAQFFADMGPKPSPELTLDRLDNDGHYEKGNCAWRTRLEQQRNRRTHIKAGARVIEHDGVKRTVREWSELTGRPITFIHRRLRDGWTPEQALTLPPNHARGGWIRPPNKADTPETTERRRVAMTQSWARRKGLDATD